MPAFLPPAREKQRRKKEPGELGASLYLRSGDGVWGPLGGGECPQSPTGIFRSAPYQRRTQTTSVEKYRKMESPALNVGKLRHRSLQV